LRIFRFSVSQKLVPLRLISRLFEKVFDFLIRDIWSGRIALRFEKVLRYDSRTNQFQLPFHFRAAGDQLLLDLSRAIRLNSFHFDRCGARFIGNREQLVQVFGEALTRLCILRQTRAKLRLLVFTNQRHVFGSEVGKKLRPPRLHLPKDQSAGKQYGHCSRNPGFVS